MFAYNKKQYLLFNKKQSQSAGIAMVGDKEFFAIVDKWSTIAPKEKGWYLAEVLQIPKDKNGKSFFVVAPIYELELEKKEDIFWYLWISDFLSKRVQEDVHLYRFLYSAVLRKELEFSIYIHFCKKQEPLENKELMYAIASLENIRKDMLKDKSCFVKGSKIYHMVQPRYILEYTLLETLSPMSLKAYKEKCVIIRYGNLEEENMLLQVLFHEKGEYCTNYQNPQLKKGVIRFQKK